MGIPLSVMWYEWLGRTGPPVQGLGWLAARRRGHTYLHQKARFQHLYISKALLPAIRQMIFTPI